MVSVADGDLQPAVVDLDARDVGPRARLQWHGLVEEPAGIRDDLVTADLVVPPPDPAAFSAPSALRDDVGAVQRVVQRAPAGVRGVQGEPRVEHGHHQLRARGGGDLVVDAGGGDGEVVGFRLQIADLGEELLVGLRVDRLDDPVPVPLVDLGLQLVAAGQQVLILRCQIGDHLVDAGPEAVRIDVGAGQRFVVDEVVQHLGDAQVPHRHAVGHSSSLTVS